MNEFWEWVFFKSSRYCFYEFGKFLAVGRKWEENSNANCRACLILCGLHGMGKEFCNLVGCGHRGLLCLANLNYRRVVQMGIECNNLYRRLWDSSGGVDHREGPGGLEWTSRRQAKVLGWIFAGKCMRPWKDSVNSVQQVCAWSMSEKRILCVLGFLCLWIYFRILIVEYSKTGLRFSNFSLSKKFTSFNICLDQLICNIMHKTLFCLDISFFKEFIIWIGSLASYLQFISNLQKRRK